MLIFLLAVLKEICSLHIGESESKTKRVHFKRLADGVVVLCAGETHMPSYSHGFFAREPHKPTYHINGFFTVSIG